MKLELDWQRKYGQFYGLYNGVQPVLTITNHELIKQILIKEFPSFMNHRHQQFYESQWEFVSYGRPTMEANA